MPRPIAPETEAAAHPWPALGALLLRDGALTGGCEACSFTGYAGRAGLFEVMPIGGEIRSLVERSTEEIFPAAVEGGMTTMR